ncbi:MAG: trypsin-like peptidase domain-containing protein [Planctomycetota bacterium]
MSAPASPSPSRAARLLVGVGLLGAGGLIGHWLQPTPAAAVEPTTLTPTAMPSLAPIVRRVRGAVVGVRTLRRADAAGYADAPGEDPDGSHGFVNGTGFVINERGLVVTNYHLVADYDTILVEVPGRSQPCNGVLVGADPVTDLAVLRIAVPEGGLPALELADSAMVEQGDWVMVMGNPLFYRQTVTVGVVSYVGRHVPDEGMMVSNELLQFSAPVNPGSSGGPVLDLTGRVVGVTTSSMGAGTGISFAVPSKVVLRSLRAMEEQGGLVRRGFLGVSLAPLGAGGSEPRGADGIGQGAMIAKVEPGSPADQAGLAEGDVVLTYDGRPVPDAYSLFDWITFASPGAEAVLGVVRGPNAVLPVPVKLGEVPLPDRLAPAPTANVRVEASSH